MVKRYESYVNNNDNSHLSMCRIIGNDDNNNNDDRGNDNNISAAAAAAGEEEEEYKFIDENDDKELPFYSRLNRVTEYLHWGIKYVYVVICNAASSSSMMHIDDE